jgi:hypothetical protein
MLWQQGAYYISYGSFTVSRKNNNILQFGIILNNKASVLESVFKIFSMAGRYFSEFLAIPKSN